MSEHSFFLLFFFFPFQALCPHSSFLETSDACYLAQLIYHDASAWPMNYHGTIYACRGYSKTRTSSVPLVINSQDQQDTIEKAISSTKLRQGLHIWTGLRVQKKFFSNSTFSSIAWLDEKKRPLPYANFADNQNPAGVACVVLDKKKGYKWITVDCKKGLYAAGAACITEKGK